MSPRRAMNDAASCFIERGVVVTEGWSGPATIVVRDGRVASLHHPEQAPLPQADDDVIDAEGGWVLPGGVDPHVHVGMALGDYTTKDDYADATRSAVFGGTTTIIDFAIPGGSGESPSAAVERQLANGAGRAWCDFALHGCVTGPTADLNEELELLARWGVPTIKLFTTYRDQVMVDEDTLMAVMRILRRTGGLAVIHAEANHLIEAAQSDGAATGAISALDLPLTRPALAETASVAWVLATAEACQAPVYFVHQSTPAAVALTQAARRRGVAAFAETCTHYLLLDDRLYRGAHPERYVCCPPLRGPEQRSGLMELALTGQIDTIGSDHCCYDSAQKLERSDDVRQMPNGLPGVETRMPLLFSELVLRRGMPIEMFASMTSTNPARLNGLYPRKGTIAPGSDADLVIWRRRPASELITHQTLHMATDFTPYEGSEVAVEVSKVLLRGEVVVDGQSMAGGRPWGEFVPGGTWSPPRALQRVRTSGIER
jgi:dihydropyrimidinase